MPYKRKMLYWVKNYGRWKSVFITADKIPKRKFDNIVGEIYNIRRPKSHKKLRVCWKNLRTYQANITTTYELPRFEFEFMGYSGPFAFPEP